MQPKVAIIIPSYNSEKFLKQTVNSALAQTYANLNVYIYDNESTDGSYEMAKKLEQTSEKVKVFQVKNIYERSYREAFEHSFENLDFDYVTFLASDDYLDPSYISSYMKIFSKKPNKIKCIQSPICGVQDGVKTGYISHAYSTLEQFKQQCLVRSPVTTPSVVYHKSVYRYLLPKSHIDNGVQYGGAEDYDMFCNLADNGIFIYSVPKFMGYYYRWHENQNTWKVHEKKKIFDYDAMIKKYWKEKWQQENK